MAVNVSGEVPLTKFFPRMYDKKNSRYSDVHPHRSAKGPEGSQGERPAKRARWTHASQDSSAPDEGSPSAPLRGGVCSERKAGRRKLQPSEPFHVITPNTSRSVTREVIDLTEDKPDDSPPNHLTPSTTKKFNLVTSCLRSLDSPLPVTANRVRSSLVLTSGPVLRTGPVLDLTIPATPISSERRQFVATKSAPLLASLRRLNLPRHISTTSSCKSLDQHNVANSDSIEPGDRTRNDGRHPPVSPRQCLPTPRSSIKPGVSNRRQRSPSLQNVLNTRELSGVQSTGVLQRSIIGQPEVSPPTSPVRESPTSDDIAQTSQSQIEKELSITVHPSELIGNGHPTFSWPCLPTSGLSVGPRTLNVRQRLHSLRDISNVRGPILPLSRGRSTDTLQSPPTSPIREDSTLCDIVLTSQSQLERELSFHMDFPDLVDQSVALSPLDLPGSRDISRTPSLRSPEVHDRMQIGMPQSPISLPRYKDEPGSDDTVSSSQCSTLPTQVKLFRDMFDNELATPLLIAEAEDVSNEEDSATVPESESDFISLFAEEGGNDATPVEVCGSDKRMMTRNSSHVSASQDSAASVMAASSSDYGSPESLPSVVEHFRAMFEDDDIWAM